MEIIENKLPENAAFTLTCTLDRDGKKGLFHLRDIDEATFLAARTLIDQKKTLDAIRFLVKNLWVGGDSPDVLKDNLVGVLSVQNSIMKLVEPLESELKKN